MYRLILAGAGAYYGYAHLGEFLSAITAAPEQIISLVVNQLMTGLRQ